MIAFHDPQLLSQQHDFKVFFVIGHPHHGHQAQHKRP
jgi:hypothetical protein